MNRGISLKGSTGANLAYQKGDAGGVAHSQSAMGKDVGSTVGGIESDNVRGNGANFAEDDLARKKKAVFGSGHQILGRNSMD